MNIHRLPGASRLTTREIDRFLKDENIRDFRALLEKKFINHGDLITSFFASLNSKMNEDEYHA
jgi:hypothetical protein